LLVFVLSPIRILANEISEVITARFNAYEKEEPKAAIEPWIIGSAIDGSRDALSQANM